MGFFPGVTAHRTNSIDVSNLSISDLKNDATTKFGMTSAGGVNPFSHTANISVFSELKQKVNSWGKNPSFTQRISLPVN